jgi:hypothetical protein
MSNDMVYYVNYDGRYYGDVKGNTWFYAREKAISLLNSKGILEVLVSKLNLQALDPYFDTIH